MKNYYLTASLVTCLLAGNAYAGGSAPFYLGGTYGSTSTDNNAGQMDDYNICTGAGSINETCTVGNDDNAYHIYGGVNISGGLGVEVGYVDLGTTANYHYSDPINLQQETTGVTVTGIARHRLGKTSPLIVYGKAGAVRWSSEVKGTIANLAGTAMQDKRVKQTGVSPTFGAGVEYQINSNMSLRAGWDRYMDIGEKKTLIRAIPAEKRFDLNTLETDVDVYSAGVNFSFF